MFVVIRTGTIRPLIDRALILHGDLAFFVEAGDFAGDGFAGGFDFVVVEFSHEFDFFPQGFASAFGEVAVGSTVGADVDCGGGAEGSF